MHARNMERYFGCLAIAEFNELLFNIFIVEITVFERTACLFGLIAWFFIQVVIGTHILRFQQLINRLTAVAAEVLVADLRIALLAGQTAVMAGKPGFGYCISHKLQVSSPKSNVFRQVTRRAFGRV